MMVEVVRRPTLCASSITDSHCAVSILSGHRTARTSSSRISAAVPGRLPKPASAKRASNSRTGTPKVRAPCQISSGEKA